MSNSTYADGTATAAAFNNPYGEVFDSAGNLYVADTGNNVIRKVTPAGVVTTFAGTAGVSGSADGTGSSAQFSGPYGLAVDSSGNLYVADTNNDTIRKITPTAVVTTIAGSPGNAGTTNGTGSAARFSLPFGLVVDGSGNLYVADTANACIRKITSTGVVTTFAGTAGSAGTTNGTGSSARFLFPTGITIDGTGNLYVSDGAASTIRKITSGAVVTTFAGTAFSSGSANGTGAAARFNYPFGLTIDASGNLYVSDSSNDTIRKITSAAVVTTIAGTAGVKGSADGVGPAATFNDPTGIAIDSSGNLFAADMSNSLIRKVTPTGVVTTFAGNTSSGCTDATGPAARFSTPAALAVDSAGNLYVSDNGNNTVRKVTTTGVVTTLAGSAGVSGTTNGTGSAARFNGPTGIATDSSGNVFVADSINYTIRKITSAGVVTTLAGQAGTNGSADGASSAARFSNPLALAIDNVGNLYLADSSNDTIRKVTPAGVVTTLAGSALSSGNVDGTGAAARFNYPSGIAIDTTGNLYVADQNNFTIRKVTPAGVVSTLAGNAGVSGSTDGVGSTALFNSPNNISIDGAGNLYVTDKGNSTIRKVTPSGNVTTPFGVPGYPGYQLGPIPSNIGTGDSVVFGGTIYLIINNGIASVPVP